MRSVAALALIACIAAAVLIAAGPRAPAQEPPYAPPPGLPVDPGVTLPGASPPAVAPSLPAPAVPAAVPARPLAPVAPRRRAVPRGPSRAVGLPWRGRLLNGVQLPAAGADHVTWDPILKRIPDRPWRRWGTAKLIATIERVLAAYHDAHPEAPQVLVGDLSRPHGGVFDKRYGGLGHASHQNGLDADVYYPRADGVLRAAFRPDQIDRGLAQALVDGFVRAGAQFVFVGTRTGLRGPRKVVEVIPHHNDHLHVRIRPAR